MIPYVTLSDWRLIEANAWGDGWPSEAVALRPFGTLVVLAVAIGVLLTLTEARRRSLPNNHVVSFVYYVVLGGFIGGHLFELVFYAPDVLMVRPAHVLAIAEGQSSFGGFLGATVGAFLFRRVHGVALMPLAEVVASAFPSAWIVGRMGCAIAHDHPGILSTSWFAVAYPAGGRLDLGLLEAAATVPLAMAFLILRRRRRPFRAYVAVMCLYYAPLRFLLDFLRATDVLDPDRRYLALTPAQWGCVLLFGVGLYFSACKRIAVPTSMNAEAPN
ncbi:MAG: prolipoprotein diacylglyceryl transferase [Polyangiaceae bacterium]